MPSKIDHEWAIIARRGDSNVRLFQVGAVKVTGATPIADQDPLSFVQAALVITLDHQLRAKEIAEYLNATVHHDGVWQVGWTAADPMTKEPTELLFRWRDRDDDIRLRLWGPEPGRLRDIAAMDPKDFAGDAEKAWQEWFTTIYRDLEIRDDRHGILAAQGQDRAMPHIRGPRFFGA